MTGRQTNEAIVDHVLRVVESAAGPAMRVGVFGLAFKGRPATSDVRGSMAEDFAAAFRNSWTAEVVGWDPLVSVVDSESIGVGFREAAEVAASPVVLVQTNHTFFGGDEFAQILVESLPEGAIVVDLWNQLPAVLGERPDVRVLALGRMTVEASK
jgi:UDP-N-acetyl-D-mannosaminuronate dehydrogenase